MGKLWDLLERSVLFKVALIGIIGGIGLYILAGWSETPEQASLSTVTGQLVRASVLIEDDIDTQYQVTLKTKGNFEEDFTIKTSFLSREKIQKLLDQTVTFSHKNGVVYAIKQGDRVLHSYAATKQEAVEGSNLLKSLGLTGISGGLLYLLLGFLVHGRRFSEAAPQPCPTEEQLYTTKPRDYIECCMLDKYFEFDDKAGRTEFWSFFAFFMVVMTCIYGLIALLKWLGVMPSDGLMVSMMPLLAGVSLIAPLLAVSARRLQDLGFSKWLLVSLVFYVTAILFLIAFMLPSKDQKPSKEKVLAEK